MSNYGQTPDAHRGPEKKSLHYTPQHHAMKVSSKGATVESGRAEEIDAAPSGKVLFPRAEGNAKGSVAKTQAARLALQRAREEDAVVGFINIGADDVSVATRHFKRTTPGALNRLEGVSLWTMRKYVRELLRVMKTWQRFEVDTAIAEAVQFVWAGRYQVLQCASGWATRDSNQKHTTSTMSPGSVEVAEPQSTKRRKRPLGTIDLYPTNDLTAANTPQERSPSNVLTPQTPVQPPENNQTDKRVILWKGDVKIPLEKETLRMDKEKLTQLMLQILYQDDMATRFDEMVSEQVDLHASNKKLELLRIANLRLDETLAKKRAAEAADVVHSEEREKVQKQVDEGLSQKGTHTDLLRKAISRPEQMEQEVSGEGYQVHVQDALVSDPMETDQVDKPEPKPQKRSTNAVERTRKTVSNHELQRLGINVQGTSSYSIGKRELDGLGEWTWWKGPRSDLPVRANMRWK
ncbi:hypothetical protein LTS18_006366 [Coniosporium uncinatum]|uniref:Uncharacterized protein n=1 Tax=Coniosporium uncinatum TaxID=93489 RepID=A0ACC3D423_9PEZI|nr:hypothetical protein LTS18_006366 [Coniosporium uncinatum]